MLPIADQFRQMGFHILATWGTANFLSHHHIENKSVNKISLGRPHVVDAIKNGEIQMVINTGTGTNARRDGYQIRRAAIQYQLPYTTTIAGALAACKAIKALKEKNFSVKTIQEFNHDI
jgi:carbamoyl-phosphate synthase large subunit